MGAGGAGSADTEGLAPPAAGANTPGMENFTPISALLGGGLIGISASWLLWSSGRVAGISGIAGGLLRPAEGDVVWRLAFVAGLLAVGALAHVFAPASLAFTAQRPLWLVGIAGLCVGVGVRYGGGCTSGHGVCGISRFSPRSLVATAVFMTTGIATVFVLHQLWGWG